MPVTREAPGALAEGAELPESLYDKLSPGPGRSAAEVADHQRWRLHSAMIEVVGEGGYEAVSVRRVSRLAGVSTGTFYDHFEGKEECFLRAYELIVRRAAARIEVPLRGDGDWRERLRRAIDVFMRVIVEEPGSARLALIEASAAGPASVKQMRATEALFEAMLKEGLARESSRTRRSPILLKGIVSGIIGVARARLLSGREQELPSMVGELSKWALSFQGGAVSGDGELKPRASTKVSPRPGSSGISSRNSYWSGDHRPLILAAVAKLAAAGSYDQLTVSRIRAAAGVSRRSFNSHFESVEDCFLEALEVRVAAALEHAAGQAKNHDWASNVYLAIDTLCAQLAVDPVLSSIALSEVFLAGPTAMRRREEMTAVIAGRILDSAPTDRRPSRVAAEASIDAVWAVLHHYVSVGQEPGQLPRLTSTLAYLVLVPTLGVPLAVDAIRQAQAFQLRSWDYEIVQTTREDPVC
jgi:AcrR family transcriptional regulator